MRNLKKEIETQYMIIYDVIKHNDVKQIASPSKDGDGGWSMKFVYIAVYIWKTWPNMHVYI